MERMTKEREAEIRRSVESAKEQLRRAPDWVSVTMTNGDFKGTLGDIESLLAEVDALRAEVERLRAAPGAVVRVASDGTVEVHGPALVDLAAARIPRVRSPDPVEVDEDVVGDLPRGPVMP